MKNYESFRIQIHYTGSKKIERIKDVRSTFRCGLVLSKKLIEGESVELVIPHDDNAVFNGGQSFADGQAEMYRKLSELSKTEPGHLFYSVAGIGSTKSVIVVDA